MANPCRLDYGSSNHLWFHACMRTIGVVPRLHMPQIAPFVVSFHRSFRMAQDSALACPNPAPSSPSSTPQARLDVASCSSEGRRPSTDDFSLDDLPTSGGRMDIVARCIRATFLLANGIRRNAGMVIVLLGGERSPTTLRIDGASARFLRPDERRLAGHIRHAPWSPSAFGRVRGGGSGHGASSGGVAGSARSPHGLIPCTCSTVMGRTCAAWTFATM